MALRRTAVTVTGAAGGDGVATAEAVSATPISGFIHAIYLSYTDSPPAGTTDVTITEAHKTPAMAILAVSNAATSGWFFPRAAAVNQANAAIADSGALIPVSDYVKVVIAQANDNDGVIAYVVWEEV